MVWTSEDEVDESENQLLISLKDPLDAGDPDAKDRPPRYASASDFSFLPKDLKIITDGGPGARTVSSIFVCRTDTPSTIGCGGVSQ
jgi:hypothetical protein